MKVVFYCRIANDELFTTTRKNPIDKKHLQNFQPYLPLIEWLKLRDSKGGIIK